MSSLTQAKLLETISQGRCLICKKPRKTVYYHMDEKTDRMFLFCCSCNRGYSVKEYCERSGIKVEDFLKGDFEFEDNSKPNEVNVMGFPRQFIPIFDARAKVGVDYIKSRKLETEGDMYYDMEYNGIAFPYYYDKHFVGAQIRLIEPWTEEDGNVTKMISLTGTKTSLLFYNWNGVLPMSTHIKYVVVTEGAFNSLALQQSLNKKYGGYLKNPFKVIALSGSNVSDHHLDMFRELMTNNIKVISAPDPDVAGLKMLNRMIDGKACTHYFIPNDLGIDINDILKENDSEFLVNYFVRKIAKV